MNVPIRIYRQHDMDLMTLFYDNSYHLVKEMKRAVIAFANETPYTPAVPTGALDTSGYIPKSVRITMYFNDSPKEQKAVELLRQCKPGYRCAFIKALFRNMNGILPLTGYTKESGFLMRKTYSVVKNDEDRQTDVAKSPQPVNTPMRNPAPVQSAPSPVIAPAQPTIAPNVTPAPVNMSAAEPGTTTATTSNENTDDLDAMFASLNALG